MSEPAGDPAPGGSGRASGLQPVLAHADLPPVWTALFAALAYGSTLVWRPDVGPWIDTAIGLSGAVVTGGSVMLMLAAAGTMLMAGTPVVPRRAPAKLVTGGPFRFTRNPIYVADVALLVGLCLLLRQPLAAVLAVPLWLILDRRFAAPEEAGLASTFGATFAGYKARVPRWL